MSIEAYWVSGSPYSWSVLLALEVKGLAYQSKLLEVSKGETKTAEFLTLNPLGQVPVLKDGDTIICESLAIIAYLDRQYPDVPLFGETSREYAHIWQSALEHVNYASPSLFKVVFPLWSGKAAEKADDIKQAAGLCHEMLAKLEEKLSNQPFMIGDQISAADIIRLPGLQCLINALNQAEAAPLKLGLLPLVTSYPKIDAWLKRIESISGYERTYPPHW